MTMTDTERDFRAWLYLYHSALFDAFATLERVTTVYVDGGSGFAHPDVRQEFLNTLHNSLEHPWSMLQMCIEDTNREAGLAEDDKK